MKLAISFLLFFVSFIAFTGCSSPEKKIPRDIASLQASGGMEGIWFVQGTSSTRGPYNGEIELRKSNDGTFSVVRIVTYINSFFDGLKVQEVWTGKAVATNDSLTISYDIKQADFIMRLGNLKRKATDFLAPVEVVSRFIPSNKGLATQFSDKNSSTYTEWLTTIRELEPEPLWINRRVNLDAKGKSIPIVVKAAITVAKGHLDFDKDPFVRTYRARPEFKDQQPYFVFDPTDFEFYRNNKDVIRVVNKVTDNISITEAVVKRNAYAPTLEEKAIGYEQNTVSNHINELGMFAHAVIGSDGQILNYAQDGDSSVWTGMYVASQAMRYLKTQDSQALVNVRKSLKGLMTLMAVTGDKKEFARTLAIYNPNEKLKDEWHRGEGVYSNIIWREGGNNDMLRGITHGFLWASRVLPQSDTALWSELRERSIALKDLRIVQEKKQNLPAALGLAALLTKDRSYKEKYLDAYETIPMKLSGLFDSSFYWRGSADWSGINLSMLGDINDIMIADLLGATKIRNQMREQLMDSWVTYQPAQRHLLTLAAYEFAYKHGTRGGNFHSDSSEEKFSRALARAPWGLRDIPYPRPNLDVAIDRSLDPSWCVSPIPKLFWKVFKKWEPPEGYFYQGMYSYPVFEMDAFGSNMVWKDSAFRFKISHTKGEELAGVDYLYAYWLARYSGAPDVN